MRWRMLDRRFAHFFRTFFATRAIKVFCKKCAQRVYSPADAAYNIIILFWFRSLKRLGSEELKRVTIT